MNDNVHVYKIYNQLLKIFRIKTFCLIKLVSN